MNLSEVFKDSDIFDRIKRKEHKVWFKGELQKTNCCGSIRLSYTLGDADIEFDRSYILSIEDILADDWEIQKDEDED